MEQEHTLQELMGEIKLLNKRIDDGIAELSKYSVVTDIDRPPIGYNKETGKFSIEIARNNMGARHQSVIDMIYRISELRKIRDKTNMETKLKVLGREFTIHQAIFFRDTMSKKLEAMGNAIVMAAASAESKASSSTITNRAGGRGTQSTVEVVQLVDVEKAKEELAEVQTIRQNIDSALTIANCTTKVKY